MAKDLLSYMGYQWIQIEGNVLTIGVSEEGLEEVSDILAVNLPTENEEVAADEICGELDSRDGPLNIYSPVDGEVIELNSAVIDTPDLISEDPFGEGWLLRIEAKSEDDIAALVQNSGELGGD